MRERNTEPLLVLYVHLSPCVCLRCACLAQGQGVLSEKLRSFSMQDLTLIQDEQELLDPTDDMSTGSQTLPRARSTSRQSTHPPHATPAHGASVHAGWMGKWVGWLDG